MTARTAFLILSCDQYAGLWQKHLHCLDEQWRDCPFPKYILTNHLEPERADIRAIKTGDDENWSANFKKALAVLRPEFDYVLVTFDDLFLTSQVDTGYLKTVLESFYDVDGQFLQLIRWHNKPGRMNSWFGHIAKGSLYRPNCVYAIWNIDVLDSLLVPQESAWEFERNGAGRSDQYDRFYAVMVSVFNYRNTVIRGKIVRQDARRFNLKPGGRLRVMTIGDAVRFRFRYWGFRLFLFVVPRRYQVRLAAIKRWMTGK